MANENINDLRMAFWGGTDAERATLLAAYASGISAADLIAHITDGFSGVRANLTATQVFVDVAGDVPVDFDTIDYDEGDWTADGVTFTVPAGVTRIQVTTCLVSTVANGNMTFYVNINGVDIVPELIFSNGFVESAYEGTRDLVVAPGDDITISADGTNSNAGEIYAGSFVSIRAF